MASRFLSRNTLTIVRGTSWGLQPSYALSSSTKLAPDETISELAKKAEAPIVESITTEPYRSSGMTITVEEPTCVAAVNGIPEEHVKDRFVRIYKPSKNAMQSGTENTHCWTIDFDNRERWENPLMGWSSTGDPLSNLKITYRDVEDAIRHCEKNGWQWYVEPEKPVAPKVKAYGYNFSWNKRYRVSTK